MAMKGFLKAAARKNTDIREFLREAAGTSGLKYVAEKNAKHLLYIPYKKEVINEGGVDKEINSLISISGSVHEWTGIDGKFRSTICLDGVTREDENGNVLNDGTCPFCDRVNDAWEIYNIRKEREEQTCGKTGAELENYMKDISSKLAQERKAKAANEYIYILVAKFKQDKQGNLVMNDTTKLPDYELKVMRLPAKRSEKIQKAVENSGVELAGTELLFDYPDTEDVRHLYSDSVVVPVIRGTANSLITKFDGLENAILEAAANFEWDGIEKSFPEWKGMTTKEAQMVCNGLFKKYDDYKLQLETNPNAKYMEYLTAGTAQNPSLTGGETKPAENPGTVAAPQVPNLDVNDAFGGIGSL